MTQLLNEKPNDEHFALLSAGCASQEKLNSSKTVGQMIKINLQKPDFVNSNGV